MIARLEARGVGKVYGRERALSGVNFALSAGDSVALLGPNGAGKSTLLSILSTLARPSSGEVRLDGNSLSTKHRGAIGLLAHEALCYSDLSARENLEFFARLYGVEAERAGRLLERVGLATAADRPARTYSRGMLQRLALARAILHRPALLLLDEPFTGLDREGCAMLAELIAEEKARGATMVLVSHDLDALPGLVTRVLMLRRGRLVLDAEAPRNGAAFRELYHEHGAAGAVPVGGAGVAAEAARS